MTNPPRISLAVPTLLYAPFYLAHCLANSQTFRCFKDIDLTHVRLARRGDHVDTLTAELLDDRVFQPEHTIMAVGDPLRMFPLPAHFNEPIVIGSLIPSMSFWAVDLATRVNQALFQSKRFRLFVHPAPMTGYTIAKYYLDEVLSVPSEHLLIESGHAADLDFEYSHVSRFQRMVSRLHVCDCVPAVQLATEPARAYELEQHAPPMQFHSLEMFKDCLMTGIVVRKTVWESKHKSILEDLCAAVCDAISLIKNRTDECAFLLGEYFESRVPHLARQYSEKCLTACLAKLGEQATWNTSLTISRESVKRSASIRKKVYPEQAEAFPYSDEAVDRYFLKTVPARRESPRECAIWEAQLEKRVKESPWWKSRDSLLVIISFAIVAIVAVLDSTNWVLRKMFGDKGVTGGDIDKAVWLIFFLIVISVCRSVSTVWITVRAALSPMTMRKVAKLVFSSVIAGAATYAIVSRFGASTGVAVSAAIGMVAIIVSCAVFTRSDSRRSIRALLGTHWRTWVSSGRSFFRAIWCWRRWLTAQ